MRLELNRRCLQAPEKMIDELPIPIEIKVILYSNHTKALRSKTFSNCFPFSDVMLFLQRQKAAAAIYVLC